MSFEPSEPDEAGTSQTLLHGVSKSASPAAHMPWTRKMTMYCTAFHTLPHHHRLLVVLVVLQLVITTVERSVLLWLDSGSTDAEYVFVALLPMALLAAYYGVHGVLTASYFELVAYRGAALVFVLRIALDAVHGVACSSAVGFPLCISFAAVSGVLFIITLALTLCGIEELRWRRFKGVGASPEVQDIYATYEWFSAARKADFALAAVSLLTDVVFSVAGLSVSAARQTAQLTLSLDIAGFVVELAWLKVGNAAVKDASAARMVAFWVLSAFQPLFGIAAFLVDATIGGGVLEREMSTVRITIALFALLGIAVRIATVIASVRLSRRFDDEAYAILRSHVFQSPLGRAGRLAGVGQGRS